MLDGKKTYICVILGIIIGALYGVGYIPEDIAIKLLGLIGFASFAALRVAIAKLFK